MRAGPAKAIFDAVVVVPEVVDQSKESYFELKYWFFSYAMHLDYTCALRRYEKDNFTKLLQVASARYASKTYSGKEISEEDARHQFGLKPPPDPGDSWQ